MLRKALLIGFISLIVIIIISLYFWLRKDYKPAPPPLVINNCVSPVLYPEDFNLQIRFPREIERVSRDFFNPDTMIVHIKDSVLYLHFFNH